MIRSAALLFAERTYDGTSIDTLVACLGVHRNSLYKTFGSKRGLYLAALRRSVEHDVAPLIARVAEAVDPVQALRAALAAPIEGVGLDLLLLAAMERAPVDTEVAHIVNEAFVALDRAAAHSVGAGDPAESGILAMGLTSVILGLRMRARAGTTSADVDRAGDALAERLERI